MAEKKTPVGLLNPIGILIGGLTIGEYVVKLYMDTDRVCSHKKSVDLKNTMKRATMFSEEKSMDKTRKLYNKLYG